MKEPVGRKLDKIGRMFQLKLQEKLKYLDIDRSFYPLLLIEAGNGITQQELAGKLHCDKVQVVRIIDYLSSNGYVERRQSRKDKRKHELAITEKAGQMLPDIKNVLESITEISFQGLSGNQIEEFYSTLTKIENNLLSQ